MSILSTIKDALHIGEAREDEELTEETVDVDQIGDDIAKSVNGGTIESDVTIVGLDTSSEVSGEAKVNVDYWTKKMKAELYRNGVANEVVESTPLELNAEDQRFISITVPKQHVEKAKEVALEVLGDDKYFIVYEK